MFLSNPRPSFLLALICVIFFEACGSSPGNQNNAIAVDEIKSEFPFSTREPEVYQADFIESDGRRETKYFMARKGDKWRIDFYDLSRPDELSYTRLKSDHGYHIDHRARTYTVIGHESDDYSMKDMADFNFFSGTEYREFDEIGREGNIIRYKVRAFEYTKEDIVISVDTSTGMVVRQEIRDNIGQKEAGSQISFIYELRNLRLEVDDSVFQIPDGYRSENRTTKTKPGQ